jgi:hypothetical protein
VLRIESYGFATSLIVDPEVKHKFAQPSSVTALIRAWLRDCTPVSRGGNLAAVVKDDEAHMREASLKMAGRLFSTSVCAKEITGDQVRAIADRLIQLLPHSTRSVHHFTAWVISTQSIFVDHDFPDRLVAALGDGLRLDMFQSATTLTTTLSALQRLCKLKPLRMRSLLVLWGVAAVTRLVDERDDVRTAAQSLLDLIAPHVAAPSEANLSEFQTALVQQLLNGGTLHALQKLAGKPSAVPSCVRAWGCITLLVGERLIDSSGSGSTELMDELLKLAIRFFADSSSSNVRAMAFEAWRSMIDNIVCWHSDFIDDAAQNAQNVFQRADRAEGLAAELRGGGGGGGDNGDEDDAVVSPRMPPELDERAYAAVLAVRGGKLVKILLTPFALVKEDESGSVLEWCVTAQFHLCTRLGPARVVSLADLVWRPVMRFLLGRSKYSGSALGLGLQLMRPSVMPETKGNHKSVSNDVLQKMQPLPPGAKTVDLARFTPLLLETMRCELERLVDVNTTPALTTQPPMRTAVAVARVAGSESDAVAVQSTATNDDDDAQLLYNDCVAHSGAWPEVREFVQTSSRVAGALDNAAPGTAAAMRVQRRSSMFVNRMIADMQGCGVAQLLLLWQCLVRRCAAALPVKARPTAVDVALVHALVFFPFSDRFGVADVGETPSPSTAARIAALRCAMVSMLGRHLGPDGDNDVLSRRAFAIGGDTLAVHLMRRMLSLPCTTTRFLVRRACVLTHISERQQREVRAQLSLTQATRVRRVLLDNSPPPSMAPLWSEVAARHVALLRRDGLFGAPLVALQYKSVDRSLGAHFDCLFAPIQRVFTPLPARDEAASESDFALLLYERNSNSNNVGGGGSTSDFWIDLWRVFCAAMHDACEAAHGAAGADAFLAHVCDGMMAVDASLSAAATPPPLTPSQLAVLAACLDTLVTCRERGRARRSHRVQPSMLYGGGAADDDDDNNNNNNNDNGDKRRPAAALSQLAAVALVRAHHSSYLAPDAGARRLARLGAQVRGGQYPPLGVLATVRRFVGSLERSADMFDMADRLHAALQLWCAEARPSARALATSEATVVAVASSSAKAPPPVLDSDTCDQLVLAAHELWTGVLDCLRACYRGAYDSAMLVRVAPLLALGFASRHRSIIATTSEFWSATFALATTLSYPLALIELLAPLRSQLALPKFPIAETATTASSAESMLAPIEPVTRFQHTAKRRVADAQQQQQQAQPLPPHVKRSRRTDNNDVDNGDNDDDDGTFVDKTNNPLVTDAMRVPPPPRSTQLDDTFIDLQYVVANENENADANDSVVHEIERELTRIEQRVASSSATLTAQQLTQIQWALSRTNFRVSSALKGKLKL